MKFVERHLGTTQEGINEMLKICGEKSIKNLIEKTIPKSIRLSQELDLPKALTEKEYLDHIKAVGSKNKNLRSLIGLGYYGTAVSYTHLTLPTKA